MGFLDKFEKGVENVTNRAMSRFSDDIEPIEIASKLRETMDKRAASFARDRSVVPNIFRIHLTPPSIERITAWGQDEMVRQMEEVATSHAADQGYSFVGPVEVSFLVNNNPNAPAIEIESSTRRGAAAPPSSCARSPPGTPNRGSAPAWRRRSHAATSRAPSTCWSLAPGSSPAASTTCCGCAPMTPLASAWSPSSRESRPRSPFPC